MIEISPKLHVGSTDDYETLRNSTTVLTSEWAVLQCTKEPYHRQALGYKGAAAPKEHPEYLYAYRDKGRRLILNMVDAADPSFFKDQLINEAIKFLDEHVPIRNVLVHCNQGKSRSPGLALLWLRRSKRLSYSYPAAKVWLVEKYPIFSPSEGIDRYLEQHWEK